MPNTAELKKLFPVMVARETASTGATLPEMDVQSTNSIASLGWQAVAAKSLAAVQNVFAPLEKFTTDYTDEVVAFGPGMDVTLKVEIVTEAGAALKDARNWNLSALKTEAIDVQCHRYSRPFLVTSADMAAGSRIEGKLKKAIDVVLASVMNDIYGVVAAANVGTKEVALAEFTPELVATELSAEISPEVDAMVLSPSYYAKLVPYSADSLKLSDGVYGIGGIYKASHVTAAGENAVGLLGGENGLTIVSRKPQMMENAGIFVTELGKIGGVSLYLKQWFEPGIEGIMHSVEAAVGAAVGVKSSLKVLVEAAAEAEA